MLSPKKSPNAIGGARGLNVCMLSAKLKGPRAGRVLGEGEVSSVLPARESNLAHFGI